MWEYVENVVHGICKPNNSNIKYDYYHHDYFAKDVHKFKILVEYPLKTGYKINIKKGIHVENINIS